MRLPPESTTEAKHSVAEKAQITVGRQSSTTSPISYGSNRNYNGNTLCMQPTQNLTTMPVAPFHSLVRPPIFAPLNPHTRSTEFMQAIRPRQFQCSSPMPIKRFPAT